MKNLSIGNNKTRATWIFMAIQIFAIFGIDALSKMAINSLIQSGFGYTFLNQMIVIGNAKHYLQNQNLILISVPMSAILLLVACSKDPEFRPLTIFAVGGALGNASELFLFGHVTDWIGISIGNVRQAFNLADCFLATAMMFLIVYCSKKIFRYLKRALVNAS